MADKDASESREGSKPNNDNNSENSELNILMKQGFQVLMATIRASNSLPKGEQWDLFCTSPLFKPVMDSIGTKALDLMAVILHHQGVYRDIRKRDLEEKYELIVEANDKILERVGTYLDELSGIRKNPTQTVSDIAIGTVSAASGSWNRDITNSAVWKEVKLGKSADTPVVLRNARVTQRPQVKFLDKIDNSSSPFEPRIKEKPNALKPLAILWESLPNEDASFSHPYEFEIEMFQGKIDSLNLVPRQAQHPKPIEETPLIMIRQEDQLLEMLQELQTQSEIAVDLEHHSYRSFQGFTCLMQISTREKDFIIDTLELRHKLYVLNEVFTHPKIVKVFHGADSDIQWLQRDLCLYVVNMFDTYQAALLLSLPRLSLAFLLKTFCNVDANKHFQLYDWRTRPLAKEAITYAREDTHYLLYIYDVLWNKLIEKGNGGTQSLESVIYRSADTCKKRYWKLIFKEDSYENMYRQSRKNFDNRQLYALKELYAWRDRTAREEDESSGYVLPNHMLLLIAEQLPKEMQGILACCNPIPPLVRQNLVLLHHIILKAREQPLVARVVTINSETCIRPTAQTNINLEGALHCPHDMTHSVDFRDDLPTLLNSINSDIAPSIHLMETHSSLPIFEEIEENEDCNESKINLPNQIHFMSPFDRYKKMLLCVEIEEENSVEDSREEEIRRDTRKLLEECMRERLAAAAENSRTFLEETFQIKEETQDCSHQHMKRPRSHDTSTCEMPGDDSLDPIIKQEALCENNSKPNSFNKDTLYQGVTAQGFSLTSEQLVENDECCPPKKKKKLIKSSVNTEPIITPLNVETKRKIAEVNECEVQSKHSSEKNFQQYDYSKVDYTQYQQSELTHSPKNVQDKFKHKGKKKQQNKSFTFARKYSNGSNKKNC